MAPLPQIRLRFSLRAFPHTAVDYGGPLITVLGRRTRRQKRNLCLFSCLATRAVHFEMAYVVDMDLFLNPFCTMVNCRGLPKEMLSANGGNFVGGNKHSSDLVKELDQDKIVKSTANQGIKWKFNPDMRLIGAHEIMIKGAKRAVYTILCNADITELISFHFILFPPLFFRELQGLKSSLHEVTGEGQRLISFHFTSPIVF